MVLVKREATYNDCLELVSRVRDEDLREILASKPDQLPDITLYDSVKLSYKNFAVIEEGIGCIAIFGVRKTHLGGIPWLICSDRLFGNSCRRFIKESKEYFSEVLEDFDLLFNHVATTNVKAHRWLTWMGFTVYKTHTNTVNGVVFYPFSYQRK